MVTVQVNSNQSDSMNVAIAPFAPYVFTVNQQAPAKQPR